MGRAGASKKSQKQGGKVGKQHRWKSKAAEASSANTAARIGGTAGPNSKRPEKADRHLNAVLFDAFSRLAHMEKLNIDKDKINVIAQNSEKFINFSINQPEFKDNFSFLSSSLDKLVKLTKYENDEKRENWQNNFLIIRKKKKYIYIYIYIYVFYLFFLQLMMKTWIL